MRFAVLASGGGSNFQALLDHTRAGDLTAECVFVACNNGSAHVLERAREAGIPAYHVSTKTEGTEEGVAAKLLELIDRHPIDLLALAGYMKKVPRGVLHRLRNRVVNIHPALLPAFGGSGYYGEKVHEAVLRRGCQLTGITLHMVNEEYDEGQIVLQRAVSVPKGADAQTLGRRVLELEHDSYWRVLQAFERGQLVPTESLRPEEALRIDPEWLKSMETVGGVPSQ